MGSSCPGGSKPACSENNGYRCEDPSYPNLDNLPSDQFLNQESQGICNNCTDLTNNQKAFQNGPQSLATLDLGDCVLLPNPSTELIVLNNGQTWCQDTFGPDFLWSGQNMTDEGFRGVCQRYAVQAITYTNNTQMPTLGDLMGLGEDTWFSVNSSSGNILNVIVQHFASQNVSATLSFLLLIPAANKQDPNVYLANLNITYQLQTSSTSVDVFSLPLKNASFINIGSIDNPVPCQTLPVDRYDPSQGFYISLTGIYQLIESFAGSDESALLNVLSSLISFNGNGGNLQFGGFDINVSIFPFEIKPSTLECIQRPEKVGYVFTTSMQVTADQLNLGTADFESCVTPVNVNDIEVNDSVPTLLQFLQNNIFFKKFTFGNNEVIERTEEKDKISAGMIGGIVVCIIAFILLVVFIIILSTRKREK